ncbi:BCCT family transporter [Tenuibacillus multivorans]|uniref:Choline-glycine betaine transporter n=1 Tax=Tenuibacillus multivorans TaxID=237069 RepID=A0A1G9WUI7_9BACI|nr:BCCT family transporter [Tenuibacillus multivorans]GEL78425.1 glycine/betaine ABC transporter [Tenuibacillus multivorans]SDM87961.1 Choline-glycine betaine transporter [Tenuibacillus multivorans]
MKIKEKYQTDDYLGEGVQKTSLFISGGFLVLFILLAFLMPEFTTKVVNNSFNFSATYFGLFWQLLMLATLIVGLILMFTRYGRVKLGKKEEPQFSNFRWIAMVLTTLLASGGVFWAASEPMSHYITTPPLFSAENLSEWDRAIPGLAQAFFHWGFSAWAVLGTVATIVLMYAHYHKGMPLKPRTILYPIFGDKIFKRYNFFGLAADVTSIIAVAAGTIGAIGFLGLQAAYAFEQIFGVPSTLFMQIAFIVILITIATISAITGVDKGIQLLSRFNVAFAVILMILILIVGPTLFVLDAFLTAEAFQIQNYIMMSLTRGDTEWLNWWTVFFWGWFIGFGPMMSIFIARISRGRTIRELIVAVAIISPIVSNFWFATLGGSGVFFEMGEPGIISGPLNDIGQEAAVMAILNQLPASSWFAFGFLIITIIFVATTADSMAYASAVAVTGNDDPSKYVRVFWALIFGAVAVALLSIGGGDDSSIGMLQNFIVVSAVPVSILLLPPVWDSVKIANKLAIEQGIKKKEERDEI